jgi:hypothetical protein
MKKAVSSSEENNPKVDPNVHGIYESKVGSPKLERVSNNVSADPRSKPELSLTAKVAEQRKGSSPA